MKNPNSPPCLCRRGSPALWSSCWCSSGPTPSALCRVHYQRIHAEDIRAGRSTAGRGAESPPSTSMPRCFGCSPGREWNIFSATPFQNTEKVSCTGVKKSRALTRTECAAGREQFPASPGDVAVPRAAGTARSRPAVTAHPGAALENRRGRRTPGRDTGVGGRGARLLLRKSTSAVLSLGSLPAGQLRERPSRHGKIEKQNLRHRPGDLGR